MTFYVLDPPRRRRGPPKAAQGSQRSGRVWSGPPFLTILAHFWVPFGVPFPQVFVTVPEPFVGVFFGIAFFSIWCARVWIWERFGWVFGGPWTSANHAKVCNCMHFHALDPLGAESFSRPAAEGGRKAFLTILAPIWVPI